MAFAQWFYNACRRAAAMLDRHSWAFLVVFSVVFLGVSAWLGATKLLDFDELYTYYPARQASAAQVWSFYSEGLDTNTPMASLLTHAALKLAGDSHLSVRLPVILGYWLMCLCIYAFVSFRCSKLYGMAAMLLPPVTSVYFYATQARAYGVVLGASAFALVCWQRAAFSGSRRVGWLIGLAASLGLCISLHYFAAFLWVPLATAELVRRWERKRFDWPVVAALAAGAFALIPFVPMAFLARKNFLGSFWARPSLGDIENSYRYFFTLAFAPLLGAVIAWLLATAGSAKGDPSGANVSAPPLAERVLVGLLALTPLYVVPATLVLGTFVPRYVLFTMTGVTILLATAVYRRANGSAVFAMVMIICLGGWFLVKYPGQGRRQMAQSGGLPFHAAQPLKNMPWMREIDARPQLPVAISPAVFYLPFVHYAPKELQTRTYYLSSLKDALKFDGSDTGDRNLLLFQRRFPVQVPNYDDFTRDHREFLLLAETTNPTWVMEKLLADKARLDLILRNGTHFLYHVSLDGR